jgi:hypothetical protein
LESWIDEIWKRSVGRETSHRLNGEPPGNSAIREGEFFEIVFSEVEYWNCEDIDSSFIATLGSGMCIFNASVEINLLLKIQSVAQWCY